MQGTPGFLAPEQTKHVDVATGFFIDEWRLSEKINVYGIGLILWCLLANETQPHQPWWVGGSDAQTSLFPLPEGRDALWTAALRELVRDCVAYDPAERPGFEEMLRRIHEVVGEDAQEDLAEGMRSGGVTEEAREENMPLFVEDRYRVGMTAEETGAVL